MRIGIDVSNHNGLIDWALVGQSGVTLAMVKVSEGTDFIDTWASRNLHGALAYGLMVGAYHYVRPGANTAIDEAVFFSACLANLPKVSLVACDSESAGVARGVALDAWHSDWLEEVENLTGHTPRLYSNVDYILNHRLGQIRQAAKYPLWLASWSSHEPTSPAPWLRPNGWQFMAGSRWPGVDEVDLSIWDY